MFHYLWYAMFSKYNIVYNTNKSLENDVGARTVDNDKSGTHFILFLIESECTI